MAGASVPGAIVVLAYLAVSLPAAMRTEDAWLRRRFGAEYDRYLAARGPAIGRRFSLARARANREYRAIAGLALVAGLLALKL
jgi:hypothetical protein